MARMIIRESPSMMIGTEATRLTARGAAWASPTETSTGGSFFEQAATMEPYL